MVVRFLYPVADYAAGEVRELSVRQARTLIRLGYAIEQIVTPKKERKETDGRSKRHPRV